MYPPVAVGQIRIAWGHDITLAGRLHLPAGTAVWVPHQAIQTASFNWDSPEKFMPGAEALLLPLTTVLRPSIVLFSKCSVHPEHMHGGAGWREPSCKAAGHVHRPAHDQY